MPGPFEAAGATHVGSEFAPLTMDRYITGLDTNRSALRDAAVPYLYSKFYQAGRFDSIWDGLNLELSAKLTLIHRPGHSVYNAQSFPSIQRYSSFRTRVDGQDVIRVLADTPGAVYDATGPNTKTLIWQKSAGAGKTSFQSVGNTLYMANGTDSIKWTVSTKSYQPNTAYTAGDFINDSNGNIQVAFGFVQGQVIQSAITAGPPPTGFPRVYNHLDITFAGDVPFAQFEEVSFTGLGLAAIANGQTLTLDLLLASNQARFILPYGASAGYGISNDTGIAYAGGSGTGATGITGTTVPVWNSISGGVTTDGGVTWICKGSAVQAMGTVPPATAPKINQSPISSPYPAWTANTFYSPNLITYNAAAPTTFVSLLTAGVTGGAEPTFNPTAGRTTADGSATWATFNAVWGAGADQYVGNIVVITMPDSTLRAFKVVVAGVTGGTAPYWLDPYGTQINDNTVVWENIGPVVEWNTIGATRAIATAQTILDSGGFLQAIQLAGISGATVPTWNEVLTQLTTDSTATWVNAGPYATAGTAATLYAYSFKSSVTLTESSLSPIATYTRLEGHNALLQGQGSPDPQIDTIRIYRSAEGGSTLLFDSEIPAPLGGAGALWSFLDTATDADLNVEIQGAINSTNNPPPAGLNALVYHMGRLWGAVGSLQYFCTGPDVSVGVGNEAWSPGNVFALPDSIARSLAWDLPSGVLICFTSSQPYAIWGEGTSTSQFYAKPFTQGSGLLSYDELDTAEGWVHMYSTDRRLLSFQPTAGYSQPSPSSEDAGAPIGDQFIKVTTGGISAALYNPGQGYVTWHSNGTNDTGLFVCDGTVGWFRFSQVTQPETGYVWSPRAAVTGGTSAVQSVETSPGLKTLLVGPGKAADLALQVTNIQIASGVVLLNHSQLFTAPVGMPFVLTGLTQVPALNGKRVYVTFSTNGYFEFATSLADVATTVETGTATGDGAWLVSGPILMRDPTTNADNETPFGAYATIGSIQLCQPTEVAEVASILLDAIKVGLSPGIAILLDEINPTTKKPFVTLEVTADDPPLLPPSETLYSQAFSALQNGSTVQCRHMQIKVSFAAENQPHEILSHTVYGRHIPQRKQE